MRRKTLRTVTLALAALFIIGAPGVYAQRSPLKDMLAKWWEHPRIQEKLQLDDAQIQQLNDIFYRYQKSLVDLRSRVEKAQLDLEHAMKQENWNENEIMNLARQAIEARNQVELKQLEMALQMRKVLTPQQWEELQKLRRQVREHMMHRMRNRGDDHKTRPPRPPQPPRAPRGDAQEPSPPPPSSR